MWPFILLLHLLNSSTKAAHDREDDAVVLEPPFPFNTPITDQQSLKEAITGAVLLVLATSLAALAAHLLFTEAIWPAMGPLYR